MDAVEQRVAERIAKITGCSRDGFESLIESDRRKQQNGRISIVIALWDALLAAERRGAWIKVTDRLPNPYTQVLVVIECGAHRFTRADEHTGKTWRGYGDNVTMWQPLPAPPEERG